MSTKLTNSNNSFSNSNGSVENEPLVPDEEFHSTEESSRTDEDDPRKLEDQLTEKKSHVINRLRACVLFVLTLASIGVSVTVYILSNDADVDAFEIQYEGNVDKIADAFQGVFTRIGAISALAADATAQSVDQNSTWPFQTLSNFHARGANARSMSGALSVSLNHMLNESDRLQWELYVLGGASHWIDDGLAFQSKIGVDTFERIIEHSSSERKVDPLHALDSATGAHFPDVGSGPFLAAWETSPVLQSGLTNSDRFQFEEVSEASRTAIEKQAAVLSGFVSASAGNASNQEGFLTSHFATLRSIKEGSSVNYLGDPMAFFSMPVFDSFGSSRKVVATAEAVIHWRSYFYDILPENVQGITLVLNNTCSGSFTYEIQGKNIYGVGWGDLHEPEFSKYREELVVELGYVEDGMNSEIPWYTDGCVYTLEVYPTQIYFNTFITGASVNVTFAVGMVFFYSILMFIFYDRLVESRQRIILAKATKSTAIVASLFPKNVRDRLLQVDVQKRKSGDGGFSALAPTQRVKSFLGGDTNGVNDVDTQPIADLFPHCTVLFADITNFTAWSSTREPAQVFVLLQALFQAFDQIAKRRRVFKVETIGDSYVAVTGLPEPQPNHAIIMARFAMECMHVMNKVFRDLEETLGPDTGDLGMRFGLHSGPVTAGVLKGDRARFQLFGDTVNTAARMESTGARNKIQISSTTAEILQQTGHQQWVKPREDGVHAKGKGVLSTFWLNFSGNGSNSDTSSVVDNKPIDVKASNKAQDRMVNWMSELLLANIKKILAVRKTTRRKTNDMEIGNMTYYPPKGMICLDEVEKCMNMSKFSAETASAVDNSSEIQIDASIVASLKKYVELVAAAYKENPFHNFSHACHVTMSVHKLLSRIVAPELTPDQYNLVKEGGDDLAKHLNDYSHGIVHDPMALFAITFAALIHDVDHQGVSNAQLAKEHPELAKNYRDKSIAEQNSVDVAWDILMMDQFKALRKCIFESKEELLRFRQLLVNVVLATDIFDKELNALRRERWTEAFSNKEPGSDVNDLRATIVIEHIIQASDVSHTMQHWHVYRKWNARLFKEMREAYRAGRMGTDPATFWYEGEIGFFDNYVIPLAKKLKECNVFGVSSHEYLTYAVKNREEWADRGEQLTAELMAETS